jgi:hypothetical protein
MATVFEHVAPIRSVGERPLLARQRWAAYAVLLCLCFFSITTGLVTAQYPPDFFEFPRAWGAVFVVAGGLGIFSVIAGRYPTVTMWAGSTMAAVAVSRGLFIGFTVPLDEWIDLLSLRSSAPVNGGNAARVIATGQWVTYGVLMFLTWPALIHDTGAAVRYKVR